MSGITAALSRVMVCGLDRPGLATDQEDRAERLLLQEGRRGRGSASLVLLLGAGPWTARARRVLSMEQERAALVEWMQG
ncbi:MAG TPA: hypothetical protein VFM53_02980 [Anaeromyxobacteraceae bacterium]|nr:hypothetical protein [Anaeromyxobacteraceae bacterium]